ncbi:hypothetical protein [Streptomyces chartreusis]|uniref:hypothetical protein n=1 Tax=Streptomyces chartreusis TaxID=1969 RepID=UPI0036444096
MDTNDLQRLAEHLEERGLRVTVNAAEKRLTATNPLNSRLTEEIVATDDSYVTSFDYEIGERGSEGECAERVARVLAIGRQEQSA